MGMPDRNPFLQRGSVRNVSQLKEDGIIRFTQIVRLGKLNWQVKPACGRFHLPSQGFQENPLQWKADVLSAGGHFHWQTNFSVP